MADFPNTIYEQRELENLPGIVFDALQPRNLFAEDILNLANEIIAIETVLGIEPAGEYETVKEWLEALSEGGGAVWGGITGTLSAQTDLQSALDDKQDDLGFTPENVANKSTDVETDQASNTKYPSVKAVYDWVIALIEGLEPADPVIPPFEVIYTGGGGYDASDMVDTVGTYSNDAPNGRSYVQCANSLNSTGRVRRYCFGGSFAPFNKKILLSGLFELSTYSSGNACFYFYAGNGDFTGAGVNDNKHFGFIVKVVSGAPRLYAVWGNGTQYSYDLGVFGGGRFNVSALFRAGVGIDFYVEGTLVYTATTNLPTGDVNFPWVYGWKNDATGYAQRVAYCHGITTKFFN